MKLVADRHYGDQSTASNCQNFSIIIIIIIIKNDIFSVQ